MLLPRRFSVPLLIWLALCKVRVSLCCLVKHYGWTSTALTWTRPLPQGKLPLWASGRLQLPAWPSPPALEPTRRPSEMPRLRIFFIFIFFFVDLSKIYVGIIFFQKCHHAAGSIGGKELPPFDPAVPSMGRAPREDTAGSNGGTSLPPIDPAVSTTAAL